MADKKHKSQAEKAASNAKAHSGKNAKASTAKNSKSAKNTSAKPESQNRIPTRVVTSIVLFLYKTILFILNIHIIC